MAVRINTVTLNGLEVLDVDLQVQVSSGLPNFIIVGLPDKAQTHAVELAAVCLGRDAQKPQRVFAGVCRRAFKAGEPVALQVE